MSKCIVWLGDWKWSFLFTHYMVREDTYLWVAPLPFLFVCYIKWGDIPPRNQTQARGLEVPTSCETLGLVIALLDYARTARFMFRLLMVHLLIDWSYRSCLIYLGHCFEMFGQIVLCNELVISQNITWKAFFAMILASLMGWHFVLHKIWNVIIHCFHKVSCASKFEWFSFFPPYQHYGC